MDLPLLPSRPHKNQISVRPHFSVLCVEVVDNDPTNRCLSSLYIETASQTKKKKKLTGTEIAVEERPPLDRKALNLFSSLPQPYKSKGLAFLFLPTRLVHSLGPQLHWP